MKQGQGFGTEWKEEGLGAIFNIGLDISKGYKVRQYPYWHLDLHSGCGWNEKMECIGSPLAFYTEALASGRRFRAYFNDANAEACEDLRRRLALHPKPSPRSGFHVSDMDAALFLQHMANVIRREEAVPRFAIGSLLFDPNGWNSSEDRLWPVLQQFAADYPRIDIILNINASLQARMRGCRKDGQEPFMRRPDIINMPAALSRPFWIVRNKPRHAGEKFILLVGRSIEAGRGRYKEFFPLESPQATHVLTTLTRWEDGQTQLQFKETA